jgi:hypothetical protein
MSFIFASLLDMRNVTGDGQSISEDAWRGRGLMYPANFYLGLGKINNLQMIGKLGKSL